MRLNRTAYLIRRQYIELMNISGRLSEKNWLEVGGSR
jgi:hypothetical protein